MRLVTKHLRHKREWRGTRQVNSGRCWLCCLRHRVFFQTPGGLMAAKPIRTLSRLVGVFLFTLSLHCAQVQQSPESLIQKLSNADPDVRGEALRALQAMPTSIVVPKILDALKTADHDSATRLVKVLGDHPDPSAIKPLIALAKQFDV